MALILIGPITNFKNFNKIWIILLGYSLSNLGVCFLSFLTFSIVTEKLKKYHSYLGLIKISNIASFILLITWAGAEFIAPLIFGLLYDILNFRKAIEIILVFQTIYIICFLLFEKIYEKYQIKRHNENSMIEEIIKKKLKRLNEKINFKSNFLK